MPVQFEEYDEEKGRMDLSEGTNAHSVLSLLASQPDLGFTPKEIHERTSVARGSIGPTLKRLEDHGLVRHKGDYWAATGEEELASRRAQLLSAEAVEERFGDDFYGRNPDWDEEVEDLGE